MNQLTGAAFACAKQLIAGVTLIGVSTLAIAQAPTIISPNDITNGNSAIGDVAGAPLTITVEGNFQLSGTLTNPTSSVDAVEISANNVNLDLNGFGVTAGNSCSGTATGTTCGVSSASPADPGAGIRVTSKNVSIRNGLVSGHRSN
jgi:hypothetical protein